jgi:hypothetical protein
MVIGGVAKFVLTIPNKNVAAVITRRRKKEVSGLLKNTVTIYSLRKTW